MNRAVFLDRDGTVIEHVHYLRDPAAVTIPEGAAGALKQLHESGFLLVLVSNQSLVGRGLGTIEDVEAVNARTVELLARESVTLDAVKYCPHTPEDGCPCRKPQPGMLLEAAKELDIDVARSAMIGDNPTDVEAGRNAGCGLNILLASEDAGIDCARAGDLAEAARIILKDS